MTRFGDFEPSTQLLVSRVLGDSFDPADDGFPSESEIWSTLDSLSSWEFKVIGLWCGRNGAPIGRVRIARLVGTEERKVQRHLNRALAKLRHPSRRRHIEPPPRKLETWTWMPDDEPFKNAKALKEFVDTSGRLTTPQRLALITGWGNLECAEIAERVLKSDVGGLTNAAVAKLELMVRTSWGYWFGSKKHRVALAGAWITELGGYAAHDPEGLILGSLRAARAVAAHSPDVQAFLDYLREMVPADYQAVASRYAAADGRVRYKSVRKAASIASQAALADEFTDGIDAAEGIAQRQSWPGDNLSMGEFNKAMRPLSVLPRAVQDAILWIVATRERAEPGLDPLVSAWVALPEPLSKRRTAI